MTEVKMINRKGHARTDSGQTQALNNSVGDKSKSFFTKTIGMELIRTFHPVGQGAFYSEEFKQDDRVVFRVVYDCGCIRGKANQQHGASVIKRWIENGKKINIEFRIDYLFISHFDYDHVSLIKTLSDEGVKIGRIILPLLSPTEKTFIINFQKVFLNQKEFKVLERLIKEPGKLLNAKVVKVKPIERDVLTVDLVFNAKENDQEEKIVESGTKFQVAIDYLDWQYIPCNYQNKVRNKLLSERLKKKFGDNFDVNELSDFSHLMKQWGKKGFRKLHDIYNKIDGNINENSMTVYSGPNNISCSGCEREINCEVTNCSTECQLHCAVCKTSWKNSKCRICPACIYTGDVNLNLAKIETWYKEWWDYVGTIQVPHHGSRLSFALSPFSAKGYCCPISCSDKCYYKHPHSCVTNTLVRTENMAIRVTESFSLVQHFDLLGVKVYCEI